MRNCASRLIEVELDLKAQLLASVAIVALAAAGPALAADLPLKAPPPAVAAWNWSGFYIGGHGGYGWGQNRSTSVDDPFFSGKFPGFNVPGFDPKGFLGGVHAGANWQSGAIVGGIEGDLSFTDIKGSSFAAPTPTSFGGGAISTGTAANSGTFDLLGSGRARLGYLVSPNVLLYGTGGLAWSHFVQNTDFRAVSLDPLFPPSFGIFSSTSTSTWRFGWVAGLGAETRLFDTNWLARLEYLHYDFGNSGSASFPIFGAPNSVRSSGDLTLDVVRAGLSYKFDPDRFAGYAPAAAGGTLSYKAPAPVTLPWTWSGYYLGAHAGYGWGRDPFSNLALFNGVPLFGVDSRGFVGGFQAGANWQSGAFVGGLEIDLSGTDIKGSTSNSVTIPGTLSQGTQTDKFDRLGSARARAGYLVTPSVLLYATGGPGWARLVTDQETVTTVVGGVPPVTTSSLVTPSWLFGWVAGAGVEARLWDTNWLARVEYLHYDLGSGMSTQNVPAGGGLVTTTTAGNRTIDVVRAGLSYKLDWPGYAGGGRSIMPVKAASAAVWSWSGFYIGGHGGYGWGRDPFTELVAATQPVRQILFPPVILSGLNSKGFAGGFQAGANWQTGSMVGGLEIDLSGTDIRGTSSIAGLDNIGRPVAMTRTDKFDLLSSARARLGYLVWPSVLLYGTGGLAWTRLDMTTISINSDGTTTTSAPSWRFGWTAGAGGEVRLWNTNWLARLEYLHYDFGNGGAMSTGFTAGTALDFLTAAATSHHLTTDVVRAGIGYKFD
jgi:outer membrane immunogenic protein